jgi:prepilin-type N-terminal cleavage/methylation domain-containing protein
MMKPTFRKNGLTLTELVVVIAVAAILLGISVPAAKKIAESFDYSTGPRSLINAALTSARTLAVAQSTPAGVRFQPDANGDFYMIFIVYNPAETNLVNGFMAAAGRKPIRLPQNIGVLEGIFKGAGTAAAKDAFLSAETGLRDAQTFSVVFSEQGQLIRFPVRVRNRDGKTKTDDSSLDPIFNTKKNVEKKIAMFCQDDYPEEGLGQEDSVHSFYIYEKNRLAEVPAGQRFTRYIANLQKEFINPYTGQLIRR